jgi:hypothetical protein
MWYDMSPQRHQLSSRFSSEAWFLDQILLGFLVLSYRRNGGLFNLGTGDVGSEGGPLARHGE